MLAELRPKMSNEKLRGLVGDLNNKRVKQSLGAEAELCLTWAFHKRYAIQVEPQLEQTKRTPDVRVENLIGQTSALLEFTSVSDADFAGDTEMRAIAQSLTELANRTSRGSGKYLEFDFHEIMGYQRGQFFRRLLAPANFVLSDPVSSRFKAWLLDKNLSEQTKIVLEADGLKVSVSRRSYPLKDLNYRGRTVPVFYDARQNPVFGRLEEKRSRGQLPIGRTNEICGIILWDAGCWAMRNAASFSASPHSVSIEQVIRTFVNESGIDFVSVISPWRPNIRGGPALEWRQLTVARYGDSRAEQFDRKIEAIARTLPRPRFEGYQARANQLRNMYHPQASGWYLAPTISSWGGERVEVRISSRALLEALATGDFRGVASKYASGGKDANFFLQELKRGRIIGACRVENGGVDEDDDHIVFEFKEDASASPFHAPKDDAPPPSQA